MQFFDYTIVLIAFVYIAFFLTTAFMFASFEIIERLHRREVLREQEIYDLEKSAAESARYNIPNGFYR